MTLALLVACAGVGAAASAWGLARGGRAARAGALVGGSVLVAVLVLALTLGADPAPPAGGTGDGGLLDGHLVPNDYVRAVAALLAMGSLLIVAVAWLEGGLDAVRGLLPASLAFIAGGTVAIASTEPALGAAAAGAAGLAALPCLGAGGPGSAGSGDGRDGLDNHDGRPGNGVGHRADMARDRGRARGLAASIRELRVTLAGAASLVAIAALAPLAAGLDAGAFGLAPGAAGTTGPSVLAGERGGLTGLLLLAVAVVAAARLGAIPFHLRVPRLTDAASPPSLPLLLAMIPVPLVLAGLLVVDAGAAPFAAPPGGERWLIVGGVLLTLVAASLAAYLQDDLRHMAGYLVIADGALVLLAFAAADPAALGLARTSLLVFLASKTALLALTAVIEARFGSRSIPDVRGWTRRAPVLAAALVITVVATFGLPGWAAASARADLAALVVPGPWNSLLGIAALATLPAFLRLLATGLGRATSRVLRASPERVRLPRPTSARSVSDEGDGEPLPAAASLAVYGRRVVTVLRHEPTLLTSLAVLVLALVAVLVSSGAFGAATSGAASVVAAPFVG